MAWGYKSIPFAEPITIQYPEGPRQSSVGPGHKLMAFQHVSAEVYTSNNDRLHRLRVAAFGPKFTSPLTTSCDPTADR